ncbi:putative sodium-coupled neutral amino acid transporter 11 [Astathelohania contejeani]|uniref:Sodium-coupled neutral amino acid transporter 11 n=1 Tax=Astathelohania contejeani TaxID=164912 RepID=A0ABQ7I0E3_9MICR|nr:putative sodium-coupled neutral amino acid transporter 11 [Thelohania contejeani]
MIRNHVEQKKLNSSHATFALVKSMVGGGVVFIPHIISQTGIIQGFFLITFIGICSSFSLFFISKSAKRTESKNISDLANRVGGKFCVRLLNLCIFMTVFITLVMSLQMTSFNLYSVLQDINMEIPVEILIISCAIINGLMCVIFRSVIKLKIVNLIGLSSITILFFYIIFLFIKNIPSISFNSISLFNFRLTTLNEIFLICFAFYSQYSFTEISNSMKNYEDIPKVIVCSNLIAGIIYYFIGLMGYCLFPSTSNNFLLNTFESPKIAIAFKAVIAIVNILGYPLFMIPARNSFLCLIDKESLSFAGNSLCSLSVALGCCLVTLFLENEMELLKILFFFFASAVMFILPAYFFKKLYGIKGIAGIFIICNMIFGIGGILMGCVNLVS